ncbi:hypothetical protein LBMAG53_10690 [Planctomycetota bacterium]|nr:hypothetical protein LBMAG53_10690 [Planctomycetota bacterium]
MVCVAVAILSGCGQAPSLPADPHAVHDHADHDHGGAGLAVTAAVRQNLGITWAKAEYRVVQGVLRLPARYEADANAEHRVQAPLAGRVTILVAPYQQVTAGQVLFTVTSPDWPRLQSELASIAAERALAPARLKNIEAHHAAVDQARAMWQERLTALDRQGKELGGVAAERSAVAARLADLDIEHTDDEERLLAVRRDLDGADGRPGLLRQRWDLLLGAAAAQTGLAVEYLLAADPAGAAGPAGGADSAGSAKAVPPPTPDPHGHHHSPTRSLATPDNDAPNPRWRTLTAIPVVASADAIITSDLPTTGTLVEAGALVLTAIDPSALRLRASALQADLPRLSRALRGRDGLTGRIVPIDPGNLATLPAVVQLAPTADGDRRTVDLIARPAAGSERPAGARPGVAALLDVVIAGSPEEDLAIPVAATIRDGLDVVFFRRNPKNPDEVLKVTADLGASDGRWVVVNSGVKEGDEVVLGGLYPLKLAQQSGGEKAGHFHSDGTFHDGKH